MALSVAISSATEPTVEADALFERVAHELERAGAHVPGATYRVQLNKHFTFKDAATLVPYLRDLGITDLYASPFFKARADSLHGYDIVDHTTLAETLGGDDAFGKLTKALRENGIGLVLDFVPNHMGIGVRDNVWWMDVLENGPSSLYASFFDIDWHPLKSELTGKVLLPILADHYGRVLESGEIKLFQETGAFYVNAGGTILPVNPRTYRYVLDRMLPPLSEALGADAEPILELRSIITGLRHLPQRTELRRQKVLERRREKEILKRRLAVLLDQSKAVHQAVDKALSEMNGRKDDPRSFDALHEMLELQAYRLSFWRVAAEEVNYRRFFDVNDLAAIRMEIPKVFEAAHQRLMRLMGEGAVTGLRIDHPDGLWNPSGYFAVLQRGYFLERCRRSWVEGASNEERAEQFTRMIPRLTTLYDQATQADPASSINRPLYLVVEKILSRGETLPTNWPVHGTSGYDFTGLVNNLFVDPAAEETMTAIYERFIGYRIDFVDLVYRKKKLVLQTSLASELNVLAAELNRLSERDRHSRDFTLGSLTDALREVIACFPVYRTYTTETTESVTEHDRASIARAIRLARQRNPTTEASVFAFVRAILLLEVPESVPPADRGRWRGFVMRFQQLTGPVMARGLEDTAFYIYNRLVSLNEVGGEPERFGGSIAAFHQANVRRKRQWPFELSATSTHDTKRSEDVRARISILSEMPEQWRTAAEDLRRLAEPLKIELEDRRVPDPNEEYLLYQTLLGTWPLGSFEGSLDADYVDRIVAYMHKATREAKVNTSWVDAAPEYDAAVQQFVRRVLASGSPVRERLEPLARDIAWFGRWSALSQALLRFTCPGVPDTYQGNETWDFSLVDPDNRRPVDFKARRKMLKEVRDESRKPKFLKEIVEHPEDGRIKMFVTHVALETRRRLPQLFGAEAQYIPIEGQEPKANHVVAFIRSNGGAELIVLAPRLVAALVHGKPVPPIGAAWDGASIVVEEGKFRNLFTGDEIITEERDGVPHLMLDRALQSFPVALLERTSRSRRSDT